MAAKPKPPGKRFQDLKPDQQKRKLSWYRRNQGLTPRQVRERYNRGTLGPQTVARGHGQTPERPEEAEKNPGKYEKYREKRKQAITFIVEFKRDKWGDKPRFNAARSKKNVSVNPETGKEWGIKDLRIIETMVRTAIRDNLDYWDIAALEDDYEPAFYYH
ncbi:MAG TPA: hypothetical protein VIY48_00775 [Candidatus Paceibacterota bacterium]